MYVNQDDDRATRRIYLVVLVGVLLVVIVLWVGVGATDAFRRVMFPAVVIVHGVLAIGVVTRRVPLAVVGTWLVGSMAALLIGRLVTWEFEFVARPEVLGGSVTTVLSGFGVVFALAFLVFGTRRGVMVSVAGFVLIYLGGGLSLVWGMLAEADSIERLAFAPVFHATLIAVLWALARNVERLAAARARAELLEVRATTDVLTGVANRRRLDDELQRLIAQAYRYGQSLSVALVDLDFFKEVNDTHGHHIGDRVLVEVADRLTTAVRDADLVGRWGGEEFLLLAPHTDHPAACALAERCREAVAGSSMQAGGVTVTASFGVATLGPDDDARSLMRRVDLALYTAKSEGRDRAVGLTDITDVDDAKAFGEASSSHGQV
jgi:diguanylate cyclase (GGDEF)-like protein